MPTLTLGEWKSVRERNPNAAATTALEAAKNSARQWHAMVVRSGADMDDVVQDIAWAMFRHSFDGFADGVSFFAIARSFAMRVVRSSTRSRCRYGCEPLSDACDTAAGDSLTTDFELDCAKLIRRLPDARRRIVLYRLERKSCSQIAETLKVSKQYVYRELARTCAALSRFLPRP